MNKYFVIILLLISCKAKIATKDSKFYNKQLDTIKQIVQEGDIVFRGGTDIESDIIRGFSINDKLFSHCGIALYKDSALKIVHSLGGHTNPSGKLLYQPIDSFLQYPDNESAGVYSLNLNDNQKKRLYRFTDSIAKSNIVFDLKFNLFTKDKLYCTELLIDALHYSINDTSIFKSSAYNVKNTKYFFLANKGSEFIFYPIDAFQQNTKLSKKKIFIFPNKN